MLKNTTKFTDEYRSLETALRENGTDYKTLEDGADEARQDRLRICRQMRNYIIHHQDEGFLDITDKQIRFIEEELQKQKMSGDVLKKHLKTVKTSCCTLDDLLIDVFGKMDRLSEAFIAVLSDDKHFIGILSIHDAIKTYTANARPKTAKVKSVRKLIPADESVFHAPTERMEDIPDKSEYGFIICTEDGTPEGKVLGILPTK